MFNPGQHRTEAADLLPVCTAAVTHIPKTLQFTDMVLLVQCSLRMNAVLPQVAGMQPTRYTGRAYSARDQLVGGQPHAVHTETILEALGMH